MTDRPTGEEMIRVKAREKSIAHLPDSVKLYCGAHSAAGFKHLICTLAKDHTGHHEMYDSPVTYSWPRD